jgi:hypothetical protein
MRTDGQTDMTQIIVAFCNFAKAPKMALIYGFTYREFVLFTYPPTHMAV